MEQTRHVGGQKHTAVTAVVASITAEHKNGLPTVDLVTIFFIKQFTKVLFV